MVKKIFSVIPKTLFWFMHTSWKKKLITIILIVIAGILLGNKYFSDNKSSYEMAVAQKHTITETVTESGVVTTNGRISIYSPTNGIVDKIYVSNGEYVTEEKKLFTVISTATPQEKAAALAAYKAARSAVQQAENARRSTGATVDRVHDSLKDKDETETFLEKEIRTTAEVANDNAYDALLSAQAQLAAAQVAYQSSQNATVTAPISGIVTNLSVVKGSSVAINNPLVPSLPVTIISGAGDTEVLISVGESDINKIKVNQTATAKFDAINNKEYTGVVRRVDENGSLASGVVKFNVYIGITNPDSGVKPGMTADVDILTNTLTDVLSVPNSAIKPYQKGRAVRRLDTGGKIKFVPVKIGVRGKEYTQILEGLSDGQEIIVSPTSEKAGKSGFFGL